MIVAGVGFRSAATLESLREAVVLACGSRKPDLIATADGKQTHAGLRALAEELQVPLSAVSRDRLVRQITPTCAQASHDAYGTGSVAEAAALAAAGEDARLLAPRHISTDRMATCAIAEGKPS